MHLRPVSPFVYAFWKNNSRFIVSLVCYLWLANLLKVINIFLAISFAQKNSN